MILPHLAWSILRCGNEEDRRWQESDTSRRRLSTKRRPAEVLPVEGMSRVDTVRQVGIRKVTLYRWRKEDGGRGGGQLRRSKVR